MHLVCPGTRPLHLREGQLQGEHGARRLCGECHDSNRLGHIPKVSPYQAHKHTSTQHKHTFSGRSWRCRSGAGGCVKVVKELHRKLIAFGCWPTAERSGKLVNTKTGKLRKPKVPADNTRGSKMDQPVVLDLSHRSPFNYIN